MLGFLPKISETTFLFLYFRENLEESNQSLLGPIDFSEELMGAQKSVRGRFLSISQKTSYLGGVELVGHKAWKIAQLSEVSSSQWPFWKWKKTHPKQLHIKRELRKKSPPPPRLNSGTTCRAWASPYPSPMPPPSTQPLPKYLSINISVLGGVWGGRGILQRIPSKRSIGPGFRSMLFYLYLCFCMLFYPFLPFLLRP